MSSFAKLVKDRKYPSHLGPMLLKESKIPQTEYKRKMCYWYSCTVNDMCSKCELKYFSRWKVFRKNDSWCFIEKSRNWMSLSDFLVYFSMSSIKARILDVLFTEVEVGGKFAGVIPHL